MGMTCAPDISMYLTYDAAMYVSLWLAVYLEIDEERVG